MLAHSKIDGSDGGGWGCDVLDSDIKFCEYGGRALLLSTRTRDDRKSQWKRKRSLDVRSA